MTELITNSTPAVQFLQDVDENRVRLPALQRDFVWGANNARDLIDSIYREFPIGNFYLWTPPQPDIEITKTHAKSLGQQSQNHLNDPNDNARYILDGQQRITTLYKLYYNKGAGDLNIYFDPAADKFVKGGSARLYSLPVKELTPEEKAKEKKKNQRRTNAIVSVGEVWNTVSKNFDDIWKDSPFATEQLTRIKKLNKVLNTFLVDIHELRGHDLEHVIEIFTRINKTGKSLTWSESLAMPSLVKVYPKIKNDIATLRNSLNLSDTMLQIITTDFIGQAIIWTLEGYTNEIKTNHSEIAIKNAYDIVSAGLAETLDIMNTMLGIQTKNMVGSGIPIIISAMAAGKEILKTRPRIPKENKEYHLSDINRSKIALYYLASTTFGTYSQGETLQADKKLHVNLIHKPNNDHVQTLFEIGKKILRNAQLRAKDGHNYISSDDIKKVQYSKGKSSPLFILLGIVLSQNRASNFVTRTTPIDFSNSHRHHIYPHSKISKSAFKHSIGNITFINGNANGDIADKMPQEYLGENFDKEKLMLHFFPENYASDTKLMTEEHAGDFILLRNEFIRSELNKFIVNLLKEASK
jgi:hypothetical protein